jgi:hypothetical protein
MGPVKVKLDGSYIRRCLTQTDEYKFIFINFRTVEYNLNIFIRTDELKKTMSKQAFAHYVRIFLERLMSSFSTSAYA